MIFRNSSPLTPQDDDASLEESRIPFGWSDFPLLKLALIPPSLIEITSDTESIDDSFSSAESRQDGPIQTPAEITELLQQVRLGDDCSLYSELSFHTSHMEDHEEDRSVSAAVKHVSFSTIEIREYRVIVGDHPSCENGLPLSLDWCHNPETVIMNVYDLPEPKRPLQKLNLLQRMSLLKAVSYECPDDMWLAERERKRQLEQEEEDILVLHHVPTRVNLFVDGRAISEAVPWKRVPVAEC